LEAIPASSRISIQWIDPFTSFMNGPFGGGIGKTTGHYDHDPHDDHHLDSTHEDEAHGDAHPDGNIYTTTPFRAQRVVV